MLDSLKNTDHKFKIKNPILIRHRVCIKCGHVILYDNVLNLWVSSVLTKYFIDDNIPSCAEILMQEVLE